MSLLELMEMFENDELDLDETIGMIQELIDEERLPYVGDRYLAAAEALASQDLVHGL